MNIPKNARIYIAGHTGMVGSALVKRFRTDGFHNLLLRTRQQLNLLDMTAVKGFFESHQPEYVVLSAARVGGIGANMAYPAEFLYENLTIQNNVIWCAHQANVKKLIFLGSSCIYPRDCPQPIKEEYFLTGQLEPTNEAYALAKIAGVKLCEKIFEQYGQDFVSCMPTNLYGEGDHFDPESSHVIPALIRRMYTAKKEGKKEILIWGSGKVRREFMYVDDAADAVLFLLKHFRDKDFINIGTGTDISIKELAFKIREIVGYSGDVVFDTTKPDGMPRKLLDVSKIEKIGWRFKTSLEDGLRITFSWFLKNYT